MKVKIGGIYRHYTHNNLYKVVALCKDSETLKDMVVYEALYPNPLSRIWVRPYSEWTEEVTDKEGNKKLRYTFVKDGEEE
jgi:hypothetical protein